MPGDDHKRTTLELVRLGKSLNFRVYSSDDVGEPVIQLPRTMIPRFCLRSIKLMLFGLMNIISHNMLLKLN